MGSNNILAATNPNDTIIQDIQTAFLQYGLGLSESEILILADKPAYLDVLFSYASNEDFCLNAECYTNNKNVFDSTFDETFSTSCANFDMAANFREAVSNCECSVNGNNTWVLFDENDPFLAPEPKWGQLGTCQNIIDQINSLNVSNMTLQQQATAIQQLLDCNLNYKRDTTTECVFINISCNDNKRYVYSYNFGWIDWHHVFRVFEWGTFYPDPNLILTSMIIALDTEMLGYAGEIFQWLKTHYDEANPNYSAFSYEDLCSNHLGAWLFANCYVRLANNEMTMEEAILELCTYANTTIPQNAPNYEFIPYMLDGNVPQVFSPFSCLTGEALYNAAKAEFCQKGLDMQIKIEQVHDEFEH